MDVTDDHLPTDACEGHRRTDGELDGADPARCLVVVVADAVPVVPVVPVPVVVPVVVVAVVAVPVLVVPVVTGAIVTAAEKLPSDVLM